MTPVEKKLIEIKFLVEDITCTGCVMDMENILLDLNGVETASLNYAAGVFTIQYDSGEIKAETIVKKVGNLGFNTKLLPQQN
jgi:copper chaperone CopZ